MPNPRVKFLAASLGVGSLLLAVATFAADEAHEWVERMNRALATRNYDGVFVHQQGNRSETLRIIHRVHEGTVTERLVSVDGSGREFVRKGAELVCYFPDRRVAIVEKRPDGTVFIGGLPGFDASAAASYLIEAKKDRTRMQGRATRLITLTPRDEFRYGYRLWIDEKTAMPVKTQLCDSRGNVIEQITFASLSLPPTIEDELLQPEVSTEGFKWVRHDLPDAPREQHGPSRWQAQNLPPGFRMSMRSEQAVTGARGPVSHLVFTDGLASVSVFIEAQSRLAQRPGVAELAAGATQLGSAAAYSVVMGDNRVTAVGEVPPETVRFIAQSLQERDPAALLEPLPALSMQPVAPPRDSAARPDPLRPVTPSRGPPYGSPEIPSFDRQPERNSLRGQ
ncbi:MAG: MucB/RseB C-terminal domain-containing protein [Steroidobacteraceae bacterium]